MSGDVFENDPPGSALVNDPGDMGPEVSFVIFALALAGGRKRLAGVSGKHGVHNAAPRPPAELGEVAPDRSGAHVSGFLTGLQDGARVFFPFDADGGGKARAGKLSTQVKAAAACTEGEADAGRWCHILEILHQNGISSSAMRFIASHVP